MTVNRGKQFEDVVKEAFEKLPNVSIDRLHDQTNGYRGSSNICDFIVYQKPFECYFECKSVHGNTLSIHSLDKTGKGEVYGNITKKQWDGLYGKSFKPGVFAGVICWWADKDVTLYFPIDTLVMLYARGYKSVRYDVLETWDPTANDLFDDVIEIHGRKKRVFFEYDMQKFLDELTL